MTTDTFASNTMSWRFTIKIHTSFIMSNVSQVIESKRCGFQYVGEAGQPLCCWINGHCFNFSCGMVEESPVPALFNNTHHTEVDLTVMVVYKLWRNDTSLRKIWGSSWIRTRDTLWTMGMNFVNRWCLICLLNQSSCGVVFLTVGWGLPTPTVNYFVL